MTPPGSRYCATEIGLIMNTGLIAWIGGPGLLEELPDRLVPPFLLDLPAEDRHLAARRAARDRVVMGRRDLAACHLDPRLVQRAEFLDPLFVGAAGEFRQVPMALRKTSRMSDW